MASRSSERRSAQNTLNPQSKLFSACSASSALIVVFCVVAAAQQNDRARTEALARRAGDRLQALQREADRLASEERTLLGDLRKLEIERQLKAEELKQIDADTAKVTSELDAIAARTAALEQSESASRPELRARIVEIYKLGRARYARLLLSAPDVRHFTEATRTVAALAKLDRERIASHEKTIADLTSSRKTLEERQRQLAGLRANAEKAQIAAQRAAQTRNDLIRDIDRKRDLNAELSGELQAAQQRLQMTLRDMSGSGFGAAGSGSIVLPLKPFKGDLDWPVPGTVRGRFGRGARGNGIEIETADAAEARAVHDGTVAYADSFAGFGNLVILDHGSQTFSLYGDLLDIAVKKGARVDKGQPVGTVGATSAGVPGLYFELRVDGQPVDPLQWLKRR
jgi:septal ring factor EnvC (AmiA/AmiB activator)